MRHSDGPTGRVGTTVRLGVTGHRNLDDVPELTHPVRVCLEQIRGRFAAFAPGPISLIPLSALAQGAELDQAKLTPLLRLKYHNSIADAVADLGSAEDIRRTFVGFQKYLYQGVAV